MRHDADVQLDEPPEEVLDDVRRRIEEGRLGRGEGSKGRQASIGSDDQGRERRHLLRDGGGGESWRWWRSRRERGGRGGGQRGASYVGAVVVAAVDLRVADAFRRRYRGWKGGGGRRREALARVVCTSQVADVGTPTDAGAVGGA